MILIAPRADAPTWSSLSMSVLYRVKGAEQLPLLNENDCLKIDRIPPYI